MTRFYNGHGVTIVDATADLPSSPIEGMMAYQKDTNELKIYDGTVWVSVLDTDAPPALQLIKPTSVSGSGVTLSGSKIVFTAAASGAFINGAFTSAYDNYLVLANFTGNAAVSYVTMQFAVAGVAATTNYANQRTYSTGSTVSSLTNENGTDEIFLSYCNDATSYSSTRMEIFSPALTQGTTMLSTATYNSSPVPSTVSAIHTTATSYDGLKIIHYGALTGAIRIYGYTNV